ncbi:hypothetical protein VNI00_007205 [Paramarasmius palmivorus]|uniref:Uncharacterized protein n=1 Tax=Paramarasmius palmivorus TaxID=297713 RepID=A0AAW0D2W4_9AGAR
MTHPTGLYTLLFGTGVYIMRNHQNVDGQNHKFYLFVTVTLYSLVTLFVVFDAMDMVRETILHFTTIQTGDFLPFVEYLSHDSLKTASYFIIVVSPTLLNIAADTMLIHRCYVIWGRQKLVAIPLIMATTAISIVGFATSIIVAMGVADSSKESNVALIYLANTIGSANYIAAPILNSILTLLTGSS